MWLGKGGGVTISGGSGILKKKKNISQLIVGRTVFRRLLANMKGTLLIEKVMKGVTLMLPL